MGHPQAHSGRAVHLGRSATGPARIVVVGGTAAGMSAAARARHHSEAAQIVVRERRRHVSSASCALPYYVGGEIKDSDELTVHTPETLRASLNLDVRAEHEVAALDTQRRVVEVITPNGAEEMGYDESIVAVGTQTVRPRKPGLDHRRVQTRRTVDDALRVYETLSNGRTSEGLPRHWRPLVLGAGFIGVEIAEAFARRDLPVTLVEAASHVLPPLDEETAAVAANALRELGVDLRVAVTALATDATSGERRMVALAGPANRAGRMVADNISGVPTRPLPPAVGAAITGIGELTAASTGANHKILQAAEIPCVTPHRRPRHHASYFPGAQVMHTRLHFQRENGKLLGAQVVGTAGVDKRIDVLATAIRAGMAALDLVELDLAYSPPYGSAEDPVNLAGMVGANLLHGALAAAHAQDLPEGDDRCFLLDVRSHGELASGHLRLRPALLLSPPRAAHSRLRRRRPVRRPDHIPAGARSVERPPGKLGKAGGVTPVAIPESYLRTQEAARQNRP